MLSRNIGEMNRISPRHLDCFGLAYRIGKIIATRLTPDLGREPLVIGQATAFLVAGGRMCGLCGVVGGRIFLPSFCLRPSAMSLSQFGFFLGPRYVFVYTYAFASWTLPRQIAVQMINNQGYKSHSVGSWHSWRYHEGACPLKQINAFRLFTLVCCVTASPSMRRASRERCRLEAPSHVDRYRGHAATVAMAQRVPGWESAFS
jgi:hypothetical protein